MTATARTNPSFVTFANFEIKTAAALLIRPAVSIQSDVDQGPWTARHRRARFRRAGAPDKRSDSRTLGSGTSFASPPAISVAFGITTAAAAAIVQCRRVPVQRLSPVLPGR